MLRMATKHTHSEALSKVKTFVPRLSSELYKGQCGKVGIVGGSFEYTGAPFYSAISSLKIVIVNNNVNNRVLTLHISFVPKVLQRL